MKKRERLTAERRKIFARESLTIMSMSKDELRQHYNEIFDRLQEYEVAEENNQIIVPPCNVGDTVYRINTSMYTKLKTIKETTITRIAIDNVGIWLFCACNPTAKCVFGKTVFLTREEAEKASKEKEALKDEKASMETV